MQVSQGSVGEAAYVNLFCTGEFFAGWLADGAGELYTPYSANTPGFKGDGTCNGRIS